jgi:hypothetical protein
MNKVMRVSGRKIAWWSSACNMQESGAEASLLEFFKSWNYLKASTSGVLDAEQYGG